MSAPEHGRQWPGGQARWHALAADIEAAARAEATTEAMSREWYQSEPMTPEEEETLF